MIYDFVVLGAGVGGLTTAAYLSKNDFQVLVVEKQNHVGGCCSSFNYENFVFDAGVHSIGSCRCGGYVDNILSDLNIKDSIVFQHNDPSDYVITNNFRLCFSRDINKTIVSLKDICSFERNNIEKFFDFIVESDWPYLYSKLIRTNFSSLLNAFFSSQILKTALSLPIYGNTGLPPSLLNAFAGVVVLKEFILDGGYFIAEGMQRLPDVLAETALASGCEIRLNKVVEGVRFDKDANVVLMMEGGEALTGKQLIVNISIASFLSELLYPNELSAKALEVVGNMQPSLSALTLYLGLNDSVCKSVDKGNLWLLCSDDLERMYDDLMAATLGPEDVSPVIFTNHLFDQKGKKSLSAFMNIPNIADKFLKEKSKVYVDNLLKKVAVVVPSLSGNIVTKTSSSPLDIVKHTNNYMGATYGWSPTVEQFYCHKLMRTLTFLNKIFFVGHWTSLGFGVPSVMNAARILSKRLCDESQ